MVCSSEDHVNTCETALQVTTRDSKLSCFHYACVAATVGDQLCCAGPWQPPADTALNKAALARLQAEENSRRLVRIANETLKY